MNELMSQLGLSSKTLVGISLSTNNLLELVRLDKAGKKIADYASVSVQYNNAIREIVNQDEFAEAVRNLFDAADLNPKNCNVLLSLPNVHFAFEQLDANITEDEIADVLQSKIEDLYIFKKNDAIVRYAIIGRNQDTGSYIVAYTAIQTRTIEFVKECFNDIGASLVWIDNAYSALLKGIQYSECSRFDFNSTSLLLITANSYSIFYMSDNKVLDYYEEPLAIKSFSNEEVYAAIANAASTTLAKYNTENLIVISETDEISAELLSSQVAFGGNIEYLDRNKWATGSFIDIQPEVAILQNQIPYISIECVGVAASFYENYDISFNFLADTVIKDFETIDILGKELTFPQYLTLMIVSGVIIAVIIFAVSYLICHSQISSYNSQSAKLEASNREMQKQIDEYQSSKTSQDIFTVAKQLQDVNQSDFIMLNAISTDIPSSVWLDKFMLASGAFTTISGKALSSNQVDEFFKNLQQRDSLLMLTKLERVQDSTLGTQGEIYSFEITNDNLAGSTEGENPQGAAPAGADGAATPGEMPSDGQNMDMNNPEGAPSLPMPEM